MYIYTLHYEYSVISLVINEKKDSIHKAKNTKAPPTNIKRFYHQCKTDSVYQEDKTRLHPPNHQYKRTL